MNNTPALKTVLLTGASGGFGYEYAQQLEALGYALLLHGRDKARLKLTMDALLHPERHRCVFADLSSRKATEAFIDALADEEIFGLVNNAGFGVWGDFSKRESIAQADVVRVDLLTPMMLTHALLPCLKKNQGCVINVSSLAGESPMPYMATYAAAKAGMTYWSEALRIELEGQVHVVTLAPGPSPTGFRDISGAPKGKGSFYSTSAHKVVAASLVCLAQGGGYCVPGIRHKLLWLTQKIVPRFLQLKILASYLKK